MAATPKTFCLCLAMTLLLLALPSNANERLTKLETTLAARLEHFASEPRLEERAVHYRSLYEESVSKIRNGGGQGGESAAKAHYTSDLIAILIDMYQEEDDLVSRLAY